MTYFFKCNLPRYFSWFFDVLSFLCSYLFGLKFFHLFISWCFSLPWCLSFPKSAINDIHMVFFSWISSIENMGKWHGKILQNKNLDVLKLLHCHIIQIITNSKTYKNIETYTLAINIMHDSYTKFSDNSVNFIGWNLQTILDFGIGISMFH